MIRSPAAPLPGLAPRTVRLAALLVDALITLPLVLTWSVALAGSLGLSFGAVALHLQERPWLAQAQALLVGTLAWVVLALTSLALGCLVLYQWFLLATRGQTIGKAAMGIRIVDLEGRPAGFFSALLLRLFVFNGLLSLVVSFSSVLLPFAGLLFWALDYVPVFGEERRCLHDYLAGTQVRWVRIVEVHVGRVLGVTAAVGLISVGIATLVMPVPVPVSAPVISPVISPAAPIAQAAPEAAKEKPLYRFTDEQGVLHVTDDLNTVPQKYRR